MVRLNGRIALRTNSSDEESSNGDRDLFPKRVGFFQMLGLTMLALKLKERWDGRMHPSNKIRHFLLIDLYRPESSD